MNAFFTKIHHFFAKIGKNCSCFDTFLALFGTFSVARIASCVLRIADSVQGTEDNSVHWVTKFLSSRETGRVLIFTL
jgi:hypothetical protein